MSYCTKVKYLSNTTLMQAYFDCHVNDKNYINDNFNICQEASIERKRLDDTPDKVLSQSRGTVSVVNCSFRMKLCWCYNSKQCIMYRIVAIMCTWLAVMHSLYGKVTSAFGHKCTAAISLKSDSLLLCLFGFWQLHFCPSTKK